MKTFALFMLGLAFLPGGISQNYVGNEKDLSSILENIGDFSQHVMNADYDKIAEAYTIDGKIFPNNKDILEGREKIKAYWQLPEGVSTTWHKVSPVEIKITGDEAYDYGYYEGKTKKASGEEVAWKGKYVIIWRKENGEWKIYLDIWNRIAD